MHQTLPPEIALGHACGPNRWRAFWDFSRSGLCARCPRDFVALSLDGCVEHRGVLCGS